MMTTLLISMVILSLLTIFANAVFNAVTEENMIVTSKRTVAILFGLNIGLMLGYIFWSI